MDPYAPNSPRDEGRRKDVSRELGDSSGPVPAVGVKYSPLTKLPTGLERLLKTHHTDRLPLASRIFVADLEGGALVAHDKTNNVILVHKDIFGFTERTFPIIRRLLVAAAIRMDRQEGVGLYVENADENTKVFAVPRWLWNLQEDDDARKFPRESIERVVERLGAEIVCAVDTKPVDATRNRALAMLAALEEHAKPQPASATIPSVITADLPPPTVPNDIKAHLLLNVVKVHCNERSPAALQTAELMARHFSDGIFGGHYTALPNGLPRPSDPWEYLSRVTHFYGISLDHGGKFPVNYAVAAEAIRSQSFFRRCYEVLDYIPVILDRAFPVGSKQLRDITEKKVLNVVSCGAGFGQEAISLYIALKKGVDRSATLKGLGIDIRVTVLSERSPVLEMLTRQTGDNFFPIAYPDHSVTSAFGDKDAAKYFLRAGDCLRPTPTVAKAIQFVSCNLENDAERRSALAGFKNNTALVCFHFVAQYLTGNARGENSKLPRTMYKDFDSILIDTGALSIFGLSEVAKRWHGAIWLDELKNGHAKVHGYPGTTEDGLFEKKPRGRWGWMFGN